MRLTSQYENKFLENKRDKVSKKLQKATRNASSGLKVQEAGDDASGLAISETMRSQIRGLAQSQRNIQDGISLLKTYEDGIMKTNEDVQRLYEISIMASNDTMEDNSRSELQVEVNELISSIKQTADTVQFNTRNLLGSGNNNDNLKIQLGANSNESITVQLTDISVENLGLSTASVVTRDQAGQLLKTSKNVISSLTRNLTIVGSQYSALEHNLDNSLTLQNNLTTIESNIRDSDMGKEIMDITIDQVLINANYTLHKYSDDQKQHIEKILFD